jgi:hypothetical protein
MGYMSPPEQQMNSSRQEIDIKVQLRAMGVNPLGDFRDQLD